MFFSMVVKNKEIRVGIDFDFNSRTGPDRRLRDVRTSRSRLRKPGVSGSRDRGTRRRSFA